MDGFSERSTGEPAMHHSPLPSSPKSASSSTSAADPAARAPSPWDDDDDGPEPAPWEEEEEEEEEPAPDDEDDDWGDDFDEDDPFAGDGVSRGRASAPAETPANAAPRHDAFTEPRKHAVLRALAKTGCILDAARAAGVSPRTVYRHQESDPHFAEHCRIALAMAATPIELTAWQRAVEGVEQEFACGGEVHVRRRYSDGLLRLLLQGANPKKYGAHAGFTRKRLAKAERKQIEREVRAELKPRKTKPQIDREAAMARIMATLFPPDEEQKARDAQRLATGWTRTADDQWIPPAGAAETAAAPDMEETPPSTPRDSM
jgi:hypothetical protein